MWNHSGSKIAVTVSHLQNFEIIQHFHYILCIEENNRKKWHLKWTRKEKHVYIFDSELQNIPLNPHFYSYLYTYCNYTSYLNSVSSIIHPPYSLANAIYAQWWTEEDVTKITCDSLTYNVTWYCMLVGQLVGSQGRRCLQHVSESGRVMVWA